MRHAPCFVTLLCATLLPSPALSEPADLPSLVSTWGSFGSGPLQFDHPHGMTVDADGLVYVCDQANNRIQVLTPDGRFVSTWGAPIADPADEDSDQPYPPYLYHPVGIAIAPDGVVFVSEHQHHRVSRWTKTGVYLGSIGSPGTPGDLAHPVEIAMDARGGYFYVASSSHGRVEKFSMAGQHVQSIGEGILDRPYSVALDGQGFLYAGDFYGDRIVKFTTAGRYVREWKAPAQQPLGGVRQMTFDRDGNLYACDANGGRVVKFTSDGAYLGEFPLPPIMEYEPKTYPAGIGIDRAGANLYVSVWGGSRVHRFTFGNQAPVCAGAHAVVESIWPPNHALVPVEIVGVTDPDGDSVRVRATGVMQDEPVRSAGGRRCLDAMIDAGGRAQVRAERETGSGANGRVYHVKFEATDGRGGRGEGEVTVCVPAQPRRECVDDGPSFNSLASCSGGTIVLEEVRELALGAIERVGSRVTIDYRLPAVSEVEVGVFDVAGRRIATLERGAREAGAHRAEWNVESVGRGVYFCRMRAGENVLTKAFVVR